MTRRVAGAWMAALVGAAAATVLAGSIQAWRANALASFDDVWQTINDTFYDPTFGGVDWEAARKELRPRVASAESADAARDVIRELLARLKHSHFVLLAPTAADATSGPAIVPFDIRITAEGAVIISVSDRAAETAGLKPGQLLRSIDGQSVDALTRGLDAPDSRSRHLLAWRRVTRELYGEDGSRTKLGVADPGGREHQLTIARALPSGQVVTLGNLPPLHVVADDREVKTRGGKRVGVIRFNFWMAQINEPVAAAVDRFRQHDGIVIDLRGNPGGLANMMSGVSGHFIGEPVLLGTMRTRQTPQPLSYRVNPRLVTSDGRRVEVFSGPVAILVDELTGSTSETFAGALQSLGRARIFGRQTLGQALPSVTKQLPSGDAFMYAIGDFTTTTGRSLEGTGVIPDVAVPLSRQVLFAGRDGDLEAALAWIDTGKRRP